MDTRQFDIVVFGATGMTGQYVFEELAKVSKRENIKFALAARNENKLKSVIKESQKYLQSLGETIDNVPTIIADINSENSLLNMCKRTKVLLNCVGSFYLLGEAVIKTCIVTETHYLDVAEESMFLEQMQLKYHEEARRKGIYILGACGFGNIICDLGISLIKRKFQGDVNSVETYCEFTCGSQRRNINFETLKALTNSFIYGIKNQNKIKDIREQLNMELFKKVPTFSYPLRKRHFLFKSEAIGKWCLPFPGCDETVSLRSQLFNYNYKNQRPVQIKTYYIMSTVNFFSTLLLSLLIAMFSNLSNYLLNYMKEADFTFIYWAEG
ncbi:lipid droplet localized protein-like isoform X1 [Centruroides sculpturatus]|uniref:lipid droplet localized protein-like isoform X1 n=1 Tax=Centruroides sculpturatus TaxID=218467 RepID=UPI000C6D38D0|nr:lipid droplet localized protein-like isoform X1 [Centruroides sculpturatus]XP_023224356.1 lipid droplet localized protein-like isoform X1 [Centruroides sculpturatus]